LERKAEPIPPFHLVNKNLLESALGRLSHSFGKELYPTIEKKATVLFYSLVKNHPFPNGNKRIATTALLTFLFVNGYWLDCKRRELYSIAKRVAKSKNQPLMETRLEEWIKSRLSATDLSPEALWHKTKSLLKIKRPRKTRQLKFPEVD